MIVSKYSDFKKWKTYICLFLNELVSLTEMLPILIYNGYSEKSLKS